MSEPIETPDHLAFGNQYSDQTRRIFDSVRDGARTWQDVQAETGVHPVSVRVQLGRLVRAGWLYRPSRGQYRVNPRAPQKFLVEDYATKKRALPTRE